MDGNFARWMALNVSTSYAKTVTATMKRLLSGGGLCARDFLAQDDLINRIYELFRPNADTYLLLPVREWDTVLGEDDLVADLSLRALSASTMYKTLVCIEWYARFLGHQYTLVGRLSRTLAWRTRNQSESSVLLHLYVPFLTVSKYNAMVVFLQRRQREYIDVYITDYLLLRNRTEEDVRRFGETELKPFLELCLRYLVYPFETKAIREMALMPVVLGGVGAAAFLASNPCVLCYTRSGGMQISYGLVNRIARETRRIVLPLPEALVCYLHFYVSCCRSNHDLSSASRVFVAADPVTGRSTGGPWEKIVRDVRLYLSRFRGMIDAAVYQVDHNYVYFSRILWSVVQTYLVGTDVLDHRAFSSSLLKCGVSVATMQSSKYYNALDSIRTLREALLFQQLPIRKNHFPILRLPGMRPDTAGVLRAEIRTFVR